MDNKLQILLEQISYPKDKYVIFEKAKLEKIVGNKTKDHYKFYISIPTTLEVDIYDEFVKYLSNFSSTIKTSVVFDVLNINKEKVNEYFNYVIDKYIEENPLLEMFKDSAVILEENNLIIEVNNIAEKMKLKTIKKDLIDYFNSFGYLNIELVININNIKGDEVMEEIKQSITADIPTNSIKQESPIILGNEITTTPSTIENIISEENDITLEVKVFGLDLFESRAKNFQILTLKITDEKDSIYCKIFIKDKEECNRLMKNIKVGNWYLIRGYTKNDSYTKELVVNARDINKSNKKDATMTDTCENKRVELHAHTFMSQMDGLIEPKKLLNQVIKLGHKALAVTDHNGVQAFPDLYRTVRDYNKKLGENDIPFKMIYGVELNMINDTVNIVLRPNDTKLIENTYVVFDFETTGFNAGGADSIIEVGAVKLHNGEIIDTFSELIDPKTKLPSKITEITGITEEMLKGKDDEETVIKRFIEWFGQLPMVAHNAKFDVSFLEMAYRKYNLGTFNNTVIDTLELSRTLDSNFARHGLSALVKRYEVPFDEDSHHRGDYDALATALVLHKMIIKLNDRNIETVNDLNKLVDKDEIHKFGRGFHINILAQNKVGLKNLFKIVSLANTKYLYKTPRILRSEISNLREGLLIGSGCYEGEVFIEARSKSEEELSNIIDFYDYVEIQPLDLYDHLLQSGDFVDKTELIENVKKINKVTEESGRLVVATGDVHHLTRNDKIYREIIANQKVPGGGRHPLARYSATIPSYHFRTTDEMLEDFSFLDSDLANRIVVTNPNKIADMVDIIEVIIETNGVPFSPRIENSVETVNNLVYGKAKELYGDPLPDLIKERVEQELSGIIKGGYDVIYLISQKLVKKSNDDGYLVGSRGSVGSSFVATMMGITEVNPLPAHYRCSNCKHTIFELDGKVLASIHSSGFDLPDLNCPKCGTLMDKDGNDMPFATFLGFDADKVPDIDLNFSGDYQWLAHEYTKELFGIDNVYRAGTIGSVAEKTAYGYVKGYCEDKGITMKSAEIDRLAMGCTGVKRTTGQHPGGIVVVPDYMDVFDFTPFQFPADDDSKLWRTTHFDYHAIDECLLKLDILGHDDPTTLRKLQDLSGIDVTKIPMDDVDTMKIFSAPDILGVTKDQILCETGCLGIPEFGTKFVVGMLIDTRPKTFSELLKISGLSHGTDVWLGNAQELVRNKICEFKDVIGCRDDIMVSLMQWGVPAKDSFKIMELVRKGKQFKDPDKWKEFEELMTSSGVPEWYIDSCRKIKYMFPKAHATAYVMSAFRIAWFKVHHPIWYYTAYYSIRCNDFEIETMIKGYDAIRKRVIELQNKGYDITKKENDILTGLEIALEATARGIKFGNIDINKSDSMHFMIEDNTLIPPFRTLDGLGDTVAKKIVEERQLGTFLSIEDLQKRGKVSGTIIDKMRSMGVLDNLDESSQLSLF